jgi:hypothetical protein
MPLWTKIVAAKETYIFAIFFVYMAHFRRRLSNAKVLPTSEVRAISHAEKVYITVDWIRK